MKTAIELFEELGYTYKIDESGLIDCSKIVNNDCYYISFGVKEFWATKSCYRPMDIGMPTFKAIQKQLEELGWLE